MACCPDRFLALEALACGQLSHARSDELLRHVEQCPPCSDTFDELAGLVAQIETPGAPGDRAAIARPSSRGLPSSASRPRVVPRLGLAAVAALLFLALGLAWLATLDGSASSLADLARLEPLRYRTSLLRSTGQIRRDSYLEAMKPYEAEDYPSAVAKLEEHVAHYPDHAPAWLYLGIARLQIGRVREAIVAFEEALVQDREELLLEPVLWYLANGHLANEQLVPALARFEQLVEIDGAYALGAREQLQRLRDFEGER